MLNFFVTEKNLSAQMVEVKKYWNFSSPLFLSSKCYQKCKKIAIWLTKKKSKRGVAKKQEAAKKQKI